MARKPRRPLPKREILRRRWRRLSPRTRKLARKKWGEGGAASDDKIMALDMIARARKLGKIDPRIRAQYYPYIAARERTTKLEKVYRHRESLKAVTWHPKRKVKIDKKGRTIK